MACCLFSTKPLSKQMIYCNWTLSCKFLWKLDKKMISFFMKMHFNMSSAKCQPFCSGLNVKSSMLQAITLVLCLNMPIQGSSILLKKALSVKDLRFIFSIKTVFPGMGFPLKRWHGFDTASSLQWEFPFWLAGIFILRQPPDFSAGIWTCYGNLARLKEWSLQCESETMIWVKV